MLEYTKYNVISNATFDQSVQGVEIPFKDVNDALVTIKVGTPTNSPTIVVKVQINDGDGNWIDYDATSVISSATTTYLEIFDCMAPAIRVVATYGGSGSFANVNIKIHTKTEN